MYIPIGKTFYVIWKVRTNQSEQWLTKADCPTIVYTDRYEAVREATRLTNTSGETFVVLEATDPYSPPAKVTITNLK